MERIEEIRAHKALFDRSHRAHIVVSPYGQTESVRGIEDAYHQAPAAIAFLLAEVDRLTASNENHAAVSAEWRTKYQALADKERESAGRVLELEAQNQKQANEIAAMKEDKAQLEYRIRELTGYYERDRI